MAKKKWETVNINDFFAPEYGPPAPVRLTQSPVRAKTRQSTIKIPKPGPMTPAGTKPAPSEKSTATVLNSLSDLPSSQKIVVQKDFEPITKSLVDRPSTIKKMSLSERLQEARAMRQRSEETRLMRLMRNIEELKKIRNRPYINPAIEEDIRQKIQRDIELDPQRILARGAIDEALDLEVDKHYDLLRGTAYADKANSFTAERIASGDSVRLGDMAMDYKSKSFRPISRAQKIKSTQAKNMYEHQNMFLKEIAQTEGMGVPIHGRQILGLPSQYAGMEGLGLGLNKQVPNLEIMKMFPGFASPVDATTQSDLAAGKSVLLQDITKPFSYPHMPTEDLQPWMKHRTYKERMAAFRASEQQRKIGRVAAIENDVLFREQQKIFNNMFGNLSEENIPKNFNVGRGLPPMLERGKFSVRDVQRINAQKTIGPMDYDFLSRYTPKVNGNFVQQATIQSTETIAEQTAERGAGRMTSRIAETLGQDTLRAASVIHSSKLGYAAIGAVAIAGAFGIGARERAQREFERQG